MKPRSPIERMVDEACGYDPDNLPKPSKIDRLAEALLAIADAAKAWSRTQSIRQRNRAGLLVPAEIKLKRVVEEWIRLGG